MNQLHIIVSGLVQGIGYRAFLRREASKLNVTGWVRNREDDALEAVLQGGDDELQNLLEKIKSGPMGARVDHVETTKESMTQTYESFEVVY